jgi:hypothetical protein
MEAGRARRRAQDREKWENGASTQPTSINNAIFEYKHGIRHFHIITAERIKKQRRQRKMEEQQEKDGKGKRPTILLFSTKGVLNTKIWETFFFSRRKSERPDVTQKSWKSML